MLEQPVSPTVSMFNALLTKVSNAAEEGTAVIAHIAENGGLEKLKKAIQKSGVREAKA